ncbi:MAG TPA: hypothetical protein VN851_03525 [Thermoanaerobaculia bacterium]|nr:hypothetical protein [Thermoanaerobaculia bacterium]
MVSETMLRGHEPRWTLLTLLFAASAALYAPLASPLSAQSGAPDPTTPSAAPTVDDLRRELAAIKAESERRIADLERRLAEVENAQAPPSVEAVPSEADLAAAAAEIAASASAPSQATAADTAPQSPAPITLVSGGGGKNFLNLSLDGLIAAGTSTARDIGSLQTGGHDPIQRGFTVQNVETVFDGAVDPYFRGQANIVFQIDDHGATTAELEEVYVTSTSLPHGLQAKAGQFFTEFGRLNPTHPHSWDFVDQPLVNGRFFGPDGLRSVGARLSWLLPTSFYSEAFLAVQNSQGETLASFRSVPGETLFGRPILTRDVATGSDLLITPRYAASFDLSDTQTVLLGASAALGPNGTGPAGKTRIYGIDGFWKWKPTNAFNGFPFVKVQGELMRRSATVDAVELSPEVALPRATFEDWGGYLQASWGYKPGHVLGLRLDRVGGDQGDSQDPALAPRWRLSPALTWFPTEFSKLRLQYNFDRSDAFRHDEHSLWLQFEFLLGAHAAHKF